MSHKIAISKRYPLVRLKKYNKKFFSSKNNYTKRCQLNEGRIPIVISQKEKNYIDKKYPGSYSDSLEYNSRKNLRKHYICPFIWCAKCNISLKPTDTIQNNDGEMTCPECGGKPINHFLAALSKDNETLIVRNNNFWSHRTKKSTPTKSTWTRMYPGLMGRSQKNIDLPCCFKNKKTSSKKKTTLKSIKGSLKVKKKKS